jgi:tRNA pseudouridine-54 N-methylase
MTDRSAFNDLKRQQNEEILLMQAAMEIAASQQDEFLEAQSLPDPSDELLARVNANVKQSIQKGQCKRTMWIVAKKIKHVAAIVLVILGLALPVSYITVDAAREAINEFFLENFGTHTVVHTQDADKQAGNAVPKGWDSSVMPTWVPSRFTNVEARAGGRTDTLSYTSEDSNDILTIEIWPTGAFVFGDTENMTEAEELTVQNVPARVWYKMDEEQYVLLFAKSDVTVQIAGSVTRDEILKIAENIYF